MWTEIFERFATDQVALLVHAYLLGLAVFSTFVVAFGIIWESEGPLGVHKVAHKLVIWGVAAEAVFTIALFVFDEGISSAQKSRIDAQQSTIIDLERRLAPRALTPEQQKSLAVALQKYEGQLFQGAVATSVPDGRSLWMSIHSALVNAKWTLVPPSSLVVGDPPAAVPISPDPDVVIFVAPTSSEQVRSASIDLQKALVADGLPAKAESVAFGDATKNPAIIVISIGPKTQ
jgi:hypothetical protein